MPVSGPTMRNAAPSETQDLLLTTAAEVATALAKEPVLGIERCGNSGNNRLYKITTASGPYALKSYPSITSDPRDRLGTEFRALQFLRQHHVECVPRAIAADSASGMALYEWINGALAKPQQAGDIDQVLAFTEQLISLSGNPDASYLKPASEAILSPQDAVTQVQARLAKLSEVAPQYPALAGYLQGQFAPLLDRTIRWAERTCQTAGMDFAAPLPREQQILSPSDFGFHNALRRPDGQLTFIDLEYFGWDDPVKLTADFVLHPGMELSADESRAFLAKMAVLAQKDPTYELRLTTIFPLIGCRWCMILLNEFLKDRLARRQYAGAAEDAASAQARQLAKAGRWAEKVTDYLKERGA